MSDVSLHTTHADTGYSGSSSNNAAATANQQQQNMDQLASIVKDDKDHDNLPALAAAFGQMTSAFGLGWHGKYNEAALMSLARGAGRAYKKIGVTRRLYKALGDASKSYQENPAKALSGLMHEGVDASISKRTNPTGHALAHAAAEGIRGTYDKDSKTAMHPVQAMTTELGARLLDMHTPEQRETVADMLNPHSTLAQRNMAVQRVGAEHLSRQLSAHPEASSALRQFGDNIHKAHKMYVSATAMAEEMKARKASIQRDVEAHYAHLPADAQQAMIAKRAREDVTLHGRTLALLKAAHPNASGSRLLEMLKGASSSGASEPPAGVGDAYHAIRALHQAQGQLNDADRDREQQGEVPLTAAEREAKVNDSVIAHLQENKDLGQLSPDGAKALEAAQAPRTRALQNQAKLDSYDNAKTDPAVRAQLATDVGREGETLTDDEVDQHRHALHGEIQKDLAEPRHGMLTAAKVAFNDTPLHKELDDHLNAAERMRQSTQDYKASMINGMKPEARAEYQELLDHHKRTGITLGKKQEHMTKYGRALDDDEVRAQLATRLGRHGEYLSDDEVKSHLDEHQADIDQLRSVRQKAQDDAEGVLKKHAKFDLLTNDVKGKLRAHTQYDQLVKHQTKLAEMQSEAAAKEVEIREHVDRIKRVMVTKDLSELTREGPAGEKALIHPQSAAGMSIRVASGDTEAAQDALHEARRILNQRLDEEVKKLPFDSPERTQLKAHMDHINDFVNGSLTGQDMVKSTIDHLNIPDTFKPHLHAIARGEVPKLDELEKSMHEANMGHKDVTDFLHVAKKFRDKGLAAGSRAMVEKSIERLPKDKHGKLTASAQLMQQLYTHGVQSYNEANLNKVKGSLQQNKEGLWSRAKKYVKNLGGRLVDSALEGAGEKPYFNTTKGADQEAADAYDRVVKAQEENKHPLVSSSVEQPRLAAAVATPSSASATAPGHENDEDDTAHEQTAERRRLGQIDHAWTSKADRVNTMPPSHEASEVFNLRAHAHPAPEDSRPLLDTTHPVQQAGTRRHDFVPGTYTPADTSTSTYHGLTRSASAAATSTEASTERMDHTPTAEVLPSAASQADREEPTRENTRGNPFFHDSSTIASPSVEEEHPQEPQASQAGAQAAAAVQAHSTDAAQAAEPLSKSALNRQAKAARKAQQAQAAKTTVITKPSAASFVKAPEGKTQVGHGVIPEDSDATQLLPGRVPKIDPRTKQPYPDGRTRLQDGGTRQVIREPAMTASTTPAASAAPEHAPPLPVAPAHVEPAHVAPPIVHPVAAAPAPRQLSAATTQTEPVATAKPVESTEEARATGQGSIHEEATSKAATSVNAAGAAMANLANSNEQAPSNAKGKKREIMDGLATAGNAAAGLGALGGPEGQAIGMGLQGATAVASAITDMAMPNEADAPPPMPAQPFVAAATTNTTINPDPITQQS